MCGRPTNSPSASSTRLERSLARIEATSSKGKRNWFSSSALEKGLPVGKRGRISADVQLAYHEASRS